jgi:hypothetical protein
MRELEDSEDHCTTVSEVEGLEGRLVCTATAAGILGHVTVSIPSLRLALTSDSYKKHRVSHGPMLNDKEDSEDVGGGIENEDTMGPYLETLWNPNGTTKGSITKLLYRDSQLRRLYTIPRCILR